MFRQVSTDSGYITIRPGERFLWNSHKWFVVELVPNSDDVLIRLDGTADMATLPDYLVAELLDQYSYDSYFWR